MVESNVTRRLAAIVAIDVAGYSRLMGADEAGTLARLKEHRAATDPIPAAHGARLVGTAGDGLLYEFPSVVDAVKCMVEVQRVMAARNAGLPDDEKMLYRVGINLGDVLVDGGEIYGDGVNVAARLEALAVPGGICLSRAARDQIRDRLDVALEDLGEIEVKNIARPVRVFRLLGDGEAPTSPTRHPPVKKTLAAVIVALLIAIASGFLWWWHPWKQPIEPADTAKMAYTLPEKPSIAVLAFDNLSDDEGKDVLGDGIAEAIITALSQSAELFVIARNSSFTYKGKPVRVQQVAEDLGVQYVMEGSVQLSLGRLRIHAQLIDALNGRHVWARAFEGDYKDIFALQDEITRKIVEVLQVKLLYGEQARMWRSATTQPEVYELQLKARRLFFKYTRADNDKARALAERMIELDPNYAGGYGTLAWTYMADRWFGWTKDPQQALDRAADLSDKALAINERDGGAHARRAAIYLERRQYPEAVAAAEKAVMLSPGSGNTIANAGWILKYAGHYHRAVELMQLALRLDPQAPLARFDQLASAYWLTGRHDEMMAIDSKIASRPLTSKRFIITHLRLAAVLWERGERDKARELVDKVLKTFPDTTISWMIKYSPIAMYKDQSIVQRLADTWREIGLLETAQ